MPTTRLITILAATTALASCTVGPEYETPAIALATSYVDGAPQPMPLVGQLEWWRGYNDPVLNDLVDRGLEQNLSIRAALLRIEEAQATLRQTGIVTQLDGGVNASRTRRGGDEVPGTVIGDSVSFQPSLVLDLFGGNLRSQQAALAALQSAELSVGTAKLSYINALVSNYIDARYFQNALTITRRALASRQETLSLVQAQREAGAAADLDVAQAQALLDTARANLPTLETGFYSSVYAIATLLAQPAQPLIDRMEQGAAQPRAGESARAGVPADLLRNRPDVRAAERDYAAAVANIGVAEAQLYPSVALSGTISTQSGVEAWSFGPALNLPLLSRPRLLANRDVAIARAEQAELAWRASVLAAVEDVQTAQTTYLRAIRSVTATQSAASSYQRVSELSRETYRAGSTTLLDFLDAERSLLNAQLSLASAVQTQAKAWGQLQIAAGRGWFVTTPNAGPVVAAPVIAAPVVATPVVATPVVAVAAD